jgi:hypothetical protein
VNKGSRIRNGVEFVLWSVESPESAKDTAKRLRTMGKRVHLIKRQLALTLADQLEKVVAGNVVRDELIVDLLRYCIQAGLEDREGLQLYENRFDLLKASEQSEIGGVTG